MRDIFDSRTYPRSHIIRRGPVMMIVGPLEEVLFSYSHISPMILHVELVLILKDSSRLHLSHSLYL